MAYKNLTINTGDLADDEYISIIVAVNKTVEEYNKNKEISSDSNFWDNHIALLESAKKKLQIAYREALE